MRERIKQVHDRNFINFDFQDIILIINDLKIAFKMKFSKNS
jgi:hypothetical protein